MGNQTKEKPWKDFIFYLNQNSVLTAGCNLNEMYPSPVSVFYVLKLTRCDVRKQSDRHFYSVSQASQALAPRPVNQKRPRPCAPCPGYRYSLFMFPQYFCVFLRK